MEIGESIYDWYDDNGCILTVVVISNSLQEQILNNMKNNVRIFREKEKAVPWLSNMSD